MTDIAALERQIRELEEGLALQDVAKSPLLLAPFVNCFDSENLEEFQFGQPGWEWQYELMRWWSENPKTIVLKCRQIGVTWLAGLWALHNLEFQPGSRTLWVSYNEAEAIKAINRIWDMRESLADVLKAGKKVLKPARDSRPSGTIQVQHPNGRVSTIVALPSTKKAGRGETAKLVVLDELAFQEYAEDTYTAVLPTAQKGGNIVMISTANGVAAETADNEFMGGNFYAHLWKNHERYGIEKKFFPWMIHPDRGPKFADERANMPPKIRAQEYPETENEAFYLTGDKFFDAEVLLEYETHKLASPAFRGRFVADESGSRGKFVKDEKGPIRVFAPPAEGRKYAIGVDVATGRGLDYSAATVVDLSTMEFVAKFHGKLDADLYAQQLHFLGKWYNTAELAVESAGGYGDAVIVLLRDGKDGRPPYPKLYRHKQFLRGDQKQHQTFGFPMTSKSRPLALEYLQRALRERELPYLDMESLGEYRTFIYRTSNPSPRAAEGANDDRVMADAIALEMFRQRGEHALDIRKSRARTIGKPPKALLAA